MSSCCFKRSIILAVIVIMAVTVAGCGGKKKPAVKTGSITGVITSSVSTKPIYNAVVSVADKSATTNYLGQYTITGLPVGSQNVSIVKQGYQSVENFATTVSESSPVTVDQALTPNQNTGKVSGVISFE